ncbi:MAG: DNA recombination protein RmuC [Betaproteobacteria bacterium]
MNDTPFLLLSGLLAALVGICLVLVVQMSGLVKRLAQADAPASADQLVARLQPLQENLERQLRDELQRNAQGQRADMAQAQQTMLQQGSEVARIQNEQIDGFRLQLGAVQQALSSGLQQQSAHQGEALARLSDSLAQQLRALAANNDARLLEMRTQMETRLAALQEGNEKKLEQMRQTVDEKLHATLEQRLGESFKQVADRLEQVHRGLGDMQVLARDVGSLNKVLTNVKTRGILGEVQLGALLEQVFTVEQYASNVEVVPGSGARVEFAIRLPQRGAGQGLGNGTGSGQGAAQGFDGAAPTWLPIDAKFPREDYERLIDAQERSDAAAVEAAAKALEQRVRLEARSIREKYIAAPHTTDFAILFLPTEGLYAEVLRRPGLMQALQMEHRIILAGPTTLLAMLNSVQMGFRTLALERRSAEVWEVLGAVKTEFGKFGDVLAKTQKKLQEASNTIEAAAVRTRAMGRKLQEVQALPDSSAGDLIGLPADDDNLD